MKHPKTYALPASLSFSSSSQPSLTPSLECSDFVELLARSNFSFLQGASHPEEMVLRAKRLRYKGLAICDVNGLYGVVRGYQAAEKPSAFDTEQLAQASLEDGSSQIPFQYLCGAELTPYDASPVVLLPMNKDGYSRLCHLITGAKRRAPKGHIVISLKHILEANEDLIVFPLPPWKEPDLKRLQDAFQDRIYLPVQKDFTWEAIRFYQQAIKLEQSMGLPLFATQRPLFHAPDRKPLHDVLTCILHKSTLEEAATRLTLNRERYLKTPQEIAHLFRERPDLVQRTLEIASRIQFSLAELRYKYPQEILPPGKSAPEFLRELVEKGLRWRYPKGTPSEFMTKVRAQVEHEMKLIIEMEYEDYFLTLWDICQFARSRGILHQGRGSAANSVVCFVLGLTSVDPVKLKLLFERFISRERGEPPDIDIDFEHERREEVIQYIYGKYGERRAAMVCTVICYRSRMAIREVAKVMGVPLPQIDALIKFMGREGLSRLLDNPGDIAKYGLSEEKFQRLLRLSLELQGFPRHLGIHTGGFVISHEPVIDIVPVESATMDGRYVIQWNKDDINTLGLMKIDVLALGMLTAVRKALDMLKSHKGINWNLAQIPSGDPDTYAMIQRADTVGVFQIESRAQMSLLPRLKPKNYYDLVIEVAIVRPGPIQGGMVHPYLRRRSGKEKVTYAHPKLKPILEKTLGIPLFQEQIMQIAVAVAGFTPGESDELRRVVSSAWKKKAVMDGLRQRVISGMLSNGLTREYAEQIYKTIEGFSSYGFPESHAASFALITYVSCYLKQHHPDIFACALLNSQPMGFYSPRQLIADAQRHKVQFLPLDVQHSGWDYKLEEAPAAPAQRVTSSGLKLRSVIRSPQTAGVLGAGSVLSSGDRRQPSTSKSDSELNSGAGVGTGTEAGAQTGVITRTEAHPDVHLSSRTTDDPRARALAATTTTSSATTTLSPAPLKRFAVRAGFRSIYGLSEDYVRVIAEQREAEGPYRDLTDLVRRTRLPRHVFIRLGAAGALASFGLSAREAMWTLQGMSFDPQSLLFGSHHFQDEPARKAEARELPPESEWQEIHREYQTKGFSIENHPLSVLRPYLLQSPARYLTAQQLASLKHRSRVRVAGLMSMLQKPPTAKGMCFISLEDETGLINLVITPDLYQKYRLTLLNTPLLDAEGWLESREGVRNIKVLSVQPLLENRQLLS